MPRLVAWTISFIVIVTVTVLLLKARKERRASTPSDPAPINNKIISIVLLLKAPRPITRRDFQEACSRAFGRTLTEDEILVTPPGPGKFVLRKGTGGLGLLNVDKPYVDDQAAAAERLRLFDLKQIMLKHEAWLSIDLLGGLPAGGKDEAYQWMGKLVAELLQSDCLGIYCVESQELNSVSKDTARMLRGPNPLVAFSYSEPDFLIAAPAGDPELEQAAAEARRRWPEFAEAFARKRSMQGFAIKIPLPASRGGLEHIWVEVKRMDALTVWGTLANDPNDLPDKKAGDEVSAPISDLEDWIYQNGKEMVGGFSVAVLEKRFRG